MNGIVVLQPPVGSSTNTPTFKWQVVPDPERAEGTSLVDIHACGVNRADLLQARGRYAPPPGASEIMGLEIAGVIRATDEGGRWRVGDQVCALLPGGGYAECAVVPNELLLPIPANMSLVEAAALPEAWYTAYLNLIWEGKLALGESVLIHAGASGVGCAAIQLAAHVGARVLATAGSQVKCERCRDLGAELAINYKEQQFEVEALAHSGGKGVNLILDTIGASYLEPNLKAVARKGRIVVIGLLGGAKGEIDLALLLGKRAQIIGSTLRDRPVKDKAELGAELVAKIWPGFADGRFKAMLDRVFPIAEAAAAHEYLRESANIGKVVLSVR